nr:ribonuclease H-like domain, reverse transcriptase, RNA-dependent DNA polymerase [Tanacetum cinerariifolium]
MDVKSAFLYGRINEEVYFTQPKGFVDPQHPKKVYKVVKALYGLHQAPRAWTATTPYEATKPKSKNEYDSPVNVHLYRSMIGSLIYLTASRPDIMFAVNACLRNQVTPTTSNLEAVKKIFKYLKGQPKLGLWYPKESPLVLESYSDSDYAEANKDRKSTTSRCSFWVEVSTLHFDHQPAQNLNPTSTSSMAALRYKDEHNKVGYLLKPTESDDYHQIIDLLRASHIRSPELGPPAIQATIDKTLYTITEELVRSQLQLTNDGGITDLPIAEIYSGMDNLRQQTSDPNALVLEHGQNSDPNPASFSRSHETDTGPFTNVEDAPVEGTFHISPPRSTQAPPVGQPSGDAKNSITLTALSSIVSTLVQKVHYLETELKDHKKFFKDVMGTLVKKVKALQVKLKTRKRKMVMSDSDQEDSGKQDVELDALRALANAAMTLDSNAPSGGSSQILATSPSVPTAGHTGASTIPPG